MSSVAGGPSAGLRRFRRQRWFDAGVEQVAKFWPSLPKCYICPTCHPRRGFLPGALAEGLLTDEHAPPKRLGGKIVALTCKECNTEAGHRYDTHAVARERLLDFTLGTSDEAIRVQLSQSGITVNANVTATRHNVSVVGLPQHNEPGNQEAWEKSLEHLADTGSSDHKFNITFTGARYNHRFALWSYLRSAYLVAFACFGYSYIYNPALHLVRQQLEVPNEDIIRIYCVTSSELERRGNWLRVVHQPVDLQSLLVRMGRHVVFLPWPASSIDIYEALLQRSKTKKRFLESLNGAFLAWPQGPQHAMDSAIIEPATAV